MSQLIRLSRLAAAAALSALLAACGGGSDDDAGEPATTTYNARAAFQQLLGTGGSWTVSGTGNDSRSYQITLSYTPSGSSLFVMDGLVYDTATQTLTLRQSGSSSDSVTQTIYHNLSTATVAGTRTTDDECSVAVATGSLPTAARVGDSGPLFRLTDYEGCVGSTAVGVSDVTWSVERNAGRAYYCLTTRYVTAGGLEIECVEANGTGGLLGNRARVRLEAPITGGTFILDASN